MGRLVQFAKGVKASVERKCFFDKLSPEIQKELRELIDLYLSGGLGPNWTIETIRREVLAPNGIVIGSNSLRRWVNHYASQKESERASGKPDAGNKNRNRNKKQ